MIEIQGASNKKKNNIIVDMKAASLIVLTTKFD